MILLTFHHKFQYLFQELAVTRTSPTILNKYKIEKQVLFHYYNSRYLPANIMFMECFTHLEEIRLGLCWASQFPSSKSLAPLNLLFTTLPSWRLKLWHKPFHNQRPTKSVLSSEFLVAYLIKVYYSADNLRSVEFGEKLWRWFQ